MNREQAIDLIVAQAMEYQQTPAQHRTEIAADWVVRKAADELLQVIYDTAGEARFDEDE